MIYFVKANNSIKIGCSDNPKHRIGGIQCSNPDKLEVLLVIDGDKSLECELHQKLKNAQHNKLI